MAKKDVAVKNWISSAERFADIFNAYLFSGKQVIHPEVLEQTKSESNIFVSDKNGTAKSIQRYRDIIMCWKGTLNLVILALENQDKIHYGMPVRICTICSTLAHPHQASKPYDNTFQIIILI